MGGGELQWQPKINNSEKSRHDETTISPQPQFGDGDEIRQDRRLDR